MKIAIIDACCNREIIANRNKTKFKKQFENLLKDEDETTIVDGKTFVREHRNKLKDSYYEIIILDDSASDVYDHVASILINKFDYAIIKETCPEDLTESRTDWDELCSDADEMYYIIDRLIYAIIHMEDKL